MTDETKRPTPLADPDRALAVPERAPPPVLAPHARFAAWQAELEATRSGGALLDLLISPTDAPQLVPMLPVDDLHRAIRRIGLEDCTELLTLVSGEQVQGILDIEAWNKDVIDTDRLDPWLQALMRAGPEVLGLRMLDLDDEVLAWVIKSSIKTIVVDDPDSFDPPDVEHVVTPDNRLCICFPASADRDMPAKIFLDWLVRRHPVYLVDLLLGSEVALPTTLQETAYRWRSGRLADRGYVDYYEALAIYTPPRTQEAQSASTDTERPSRHWLTAVIDPEVRLGAAIAALDGDAQVRLEQQLGYVANTILSADRVEPWDLDAQRASLQRLRAGLVLGLDATAGPDGDPRVDGQTLSTRGPANVFRLGYARMLEAARPLRRAAIRAALRSGDEPLGAIDQRAWHGWAEALVDRHPRRPDGTPLRAADLPEAARMARDLAGLAQAASDRPDAVGIGAWLTTRLARAALKLEGGGRLPADRLGDAHRALFADGALRPEIRDAASIWWAEQLGAVHGLDLLLDAMEDRLAAVDPDILEPRFAPWLLVAP